jgi:putative intracellular protease/amidase
MTMAATIDVLDPANPKRVLLFASNPSISERTGWPIGFWWAELTHPYWDLRQHGYQIDIASPDGGALEADMLSDPRDKSGYSVDDLISLGFVNSPEHAKLVETHWRSPTSWPVYTTPRCSSAAKRRCTRSSTTSACSRWSRRSTRQAP